MRDWIGSPREWGEWGMRATAWFNELVDTVRNSRWISDDGTFGFYRADSGTNRLREFYYDDDGSVTVERWYDGVRGEIVSQDNHLFYKDDGGTAMLYLDRGTGVAQTFVTTQVAASFSSGWSDYAGGYGPVIAYKDINGFVRLTGLARNTSGGSKAAGSTILVLPLGYRPLANQRQIFNQMARTDVSTRVDVHPDGRVTHEVTAVANGGYVSLAGITFYVGW